VTQKEFWNPYPTIGGTIDKWASSSSEYWTEYSQQLQIYGQPQKVWIQICEDTQVQATPAMVNQVLETLRTLSPNVTVYISPLNTYDPVGFCNITGQNGVQDSSALANQAVSQGLALQGPILGPLNAQTTESDGCHPNAAGRQLLGTQLEEFFNGISGQGDNPVPEFEGTAMMLFLGLATSVFILRRRF